MKTTCSAYSSRSPNHRSAFTLIELLVVVAIIAILVGMVVGIAGYASRKAAVGKAVSELERIKSALEEYRINNGRYFNFDGAVTNNIFITNVLSTVYPNVKDQKTLKQLAGFDGTDPWARSYRYSNSTPYVYKLWSRGALDTDDSDNIEGGSGEM